MKKVRRVVTIMLGCMLLLGSSLSASASNLPYNAGPCPYCNGPNTGELITPYNCRYCSAPGGQYKCGRCSNIFYTCETAGTFK